MQKQLCIFNKLQFVFATFETWIPRHFTPSIQNRNVHHVKPASDLTWKQSIAGIERHLQHLSATKKLQVDQIAEATQHVLKLASQSSLPFQKVMTISQMASHAQILNLDFWEFMTSQTLLHASELTTSRLAALLGSFARVDYRSVEGLDVLSKVALHLLPEMPPSYISRLAHSFFCLHYFHPLLQKSFKERVKYELSLTQNWSRRRLIGGSQEHTFDLQALCLLAYTFLGSGESDLQFIESLLRPIRMNRDLIDKHKAHLLSLVEVACRQIPNASHILSSATLNYFDSLRDTYKHTSSTDLHAQWPKKVSFVLKQMGIAVNLFQNCGPLIKDLYLPQKNVVIQCAGQQHYYLNTLDLTSKFKFKVRLLGSQKFNCRILSFYEWQNATTTSEQVQLLLHWGEGNGIHREWDGLDASI